jgi:two-component sensor histidine kinase
MHERSLFPTGEATGQRKVIPSTSATGPRRQLEEAALLTKDGRQIPVQISVAPLYLHGRHLVLALMTDITERKQIEARLRDSLREKEVLLAEVHHRVKNNLQIVSSLLNLQARHLTDPAALDVLSNTRDRVRAMASVHERLYECGDFAQLEMAVHLGNLARTLMRAHAPAGVNIQPVLRLEPVTLDLNTAVPLSLIANELITNALKHAFAGRRDGTLTIGLRTADGRHELSVADDGPGFPSAIDPTTARTLGQRLVRDLARQIRGELEIDTASSGTRIVIRWPA